MNKTLRNCQLLGWNSWKQDPGEDLHRMEAIQLNMWKSVLDPPRSLKPNTRMWVNSLCMKHLECGLITVRAITSLTKCSEGRWLHVQTICFTKDSNHVSGPPTHTLPTSPYACGFLHLLTISRGGGSYPLPPYYTMFKECEKGDTGTNPSLLHLKCVSLHPFTKTKRNKT